MTNQGKEANMLCETNNEVAPKLTRDAVSLIDGPYTYEVADSCRERFPPPVKCAGDAEDYTFSQSAWNVVLAELGLDVVEIAPDAIEVGTCEVA